MPTIAALIPAHNEALHIGAVVQQAIAHVPVLVVDDGSTDDTGQRAKRAGATVVRQAPNQGKGQALRTGFRRALDEGFEAVVALDGDGQHDPCEIPCFLQAYSSSTADLIIGRRTFSQMPLVRRVSNTLGTWAFSWAVSQPIPDNQSGYRLIAHRLMAATLDSHETGFEFEVEMIVRCIELGLKLDWIPIRTIYADEESHIRPWHHLVHFIRITRQARQRIRRTR
jgi:glycosyltransferase involved in cell wall biosynthesis